MIVGTTGSHGFDTKSIFQRVLGLNGSKHGWVQDRSQTENWFAVILSKKVLWSTIDHLSSHTRAAT